MIPQQHCPLRRFSGLAVLLLVGSCGVAPASKAFAQPASTPSSATSPTAASPTPPKPPPFRVFRYDENYAYLADPARRTHPLDSIKYIPLDDDDAFVLSFGGESRSRYEYFSAPAFGLRGPGHDDFFLHCFTLTCKSASMRGSTGARSSNSSPGSLPAMSFPSPAIRTTRWTSNKPLARSASVTRVLPL